MIISSEITGKTYKTVEECLAAEKEFEKQKEEKAKAEAKKKEELDKALEDVIKSCEKYLDLAGINYKILDSLDGSAAQDYMFAALLKDILDI